MERVARYGKTIAKENHGGEVADLLLKAAGELSDDPGCELYLINRETGAPDTIWVTEVWRSRPTSTRRARRSAAATTSLR